MRRCCLSPIGRLLWHSPPLPPRLASFNLDCALAPCSNGCAAWLAPTRAGNDSGAEYLKDMKLRHDWLVYPKVDSRHLAIANFAKPILPRIWTGVVVRDDHT